MTSQGQRFRRRALRRGYKVDEVDTFLDRVEATLAGDLMGAQVAAQEVHDVVFRVRFGGYDEWQVDLHLDRVERQLADMEERGGTALPSAMPRMMTAERMPPESGIRIGTDRRAANAFAGDRLPPDRVPERPMPPRRFGRVAEVPAGSRGPDVRPGGPPASDLRTGEIRVGPPQYDDRMDEPTGRFDGFAAGRNSAPPAGPGPGPGGFPTAGRGGFAGGPGATGEPRMPAQGGPPPDFGPPSGQPPMGGPAPAGPPPMAGDAARIDQLRRSFQPRRFGSGYDPRQVDRLFEELIALTSGRGGARFNDSDLDPGRFELVPGGYFEAEVDQALREVRDLLHRR